MEVYNLQKTINETNINQNLNDNNNNNNNNLNNINDDRNNNQYLTLGNLDNSPKEKSEEANQRRKHSNSISKKNLSELNKILCQSDLIIEEKQTSKLLENIRESSKVNRNVNGKVSFDLNHSDNPKIFVKEENIIAKMKRFNSNNNTHAMNSGNFHYQDYKIFFYLTFESIKHNTNKTHIFKEIDVEKLYKYSLIHSIPFYKVSILCYYSFFF